MNISEISTLTGLSIDTLRYYEKIELIDSVSRTSGGKREYSKENLDQLNFIVCMKKAGCSLELIKQYRTLYELGSETTEARLGLLESQRQVLIDTIDELQQSVEFLDHKIDFTKSAYKA